MFLSSFLQHFRAKGDLVRDLAEADLLAQQHLNALVEERARVLAMVEMNHKQQDAIQDWQEHAGSVEAGQKELTAELEGEREERKGAERYIQYMKEQRTELQQKYDHLKGLHSDRVRVCSVALDPAKLTSQLRAIEPTLRAEWDGAKIVVYADVRLTQAQHNAVLMAVAPQADLT